MAFIRDIDKILTISDKDIKKYIVSIFEEKFAYMGRANYLRWINKNVTIDRLKKLTVELMTEEEKKAEPSTAGYYTSGTNDVKTTNLNSDHIIDHELNHFLNDEIILNIKHFPRFINEGITEFLTQNTIKNKRFGIAYAEAVTFVKLLCSIYGDEIIKCYLSGVSDEFQRKFDYSTKSNHENSFELIMANIMSNVHRQDYDLKAHFKNKKLSLEDTYKEFAEYLEIILKNSIRYETINFMYYDEEGNINTKLLMEKISERMNIINSFLPDITKNINKSLKGELIKEVLENSYLKKYYSKEEIDSLVNDGNLNDKLLKEMTDKCDNKLFYTTEIRIQENLKNVSDFSSFILDFYKYSSLVEFKGKEEFFSRLLKGYLMDNIRGKGDISEFNNMIPYIQPFFKRMAKFELDGEKTFSTVKTTRLNLFDNVDVFLVQRDSVYYIFEYNRETNQYSEQALKYDNLSNNVGRFSLKTAHYDGVIRVGEEIIFRGEKLHPSEGMTPMANSVIANSLGILNYKDYVCYLNDGKNIERKGLSYLGNFELLNTNSRVIDFSAIIEDIRDKISYFGQNIINDTVNIIVNKSLSAAYGNMKVTDEVKEALRVKILSGVKNNPTDFGDISVELIKQWKNYIEESREKRGGLFIYNDEASKKYFENEERIKYQSLFKQRLTDDLDQYIIEKNEDYYSEKDLAYGVEDVKFFKYAYYNIPKFKRIDYKKLIDDAREKMKEVPEEHIHNYLYGVQNTFWNQLGDCDDDDKIDELTSKISDIFGEAVKTGNYDIEELNTLTSYLMMLYKEKKDEMRAKASKRDKVGKYMNKEAVLYYNSIKSIMSDPSISEEDKKSDVEILARLANREIEKVKKNDDLVLKLDINEAVEKQRKIRKDKKTSNYKK